MAEPATESAFESSIPDASVEAVAEAALEHISQQQQQLQQQQHEPVEVPKLPTPLPAGWVMKESRSNPDHCYYYHQVTGVSTWTAPLALEESVQDDDEGDDDEVMHEDDVGDPEAPRLDYAQESLSIEPLHPSKRPATEESPSPRESKRTKPLPKQVRVLHILKKHKNSRRPASWRVPKITISKEEATREIEGLLAVLEDVRSDSAELRATFEELARTESDCSSAKRGGDLGFFGPKKMQPAFEEASFALQVGELSGVVETSSGVHALFRVG
jgi:peptidyl-prolyl cis-trans isomerase NIMA-interacting 1